MMDQSPEVNLLLVGIGGYGNAYLETIAEHTKSKLVAVVDPMPQLAPGWSELQAKNIPTFPSVREFLASGIKAQLAIIASPISFHADQSCTLLAAGINVLCEKPIAATMLEVRRMQQARDASGCFLEIGYQWCYSEAIQSLKKDILEGILGAPKLLSTRVEWPRDSTYYARNNWAGCIKDKHGNIVNDSPVGNATAHYLNNMLYLIGDDIHLSTRIKTVTGECYRANPIENYDTACCRIETEAKANILFYTTHAVKDRDGPVFRYIFEKAEINYEDGGDIIAIFHDGTSKCYGNPDAVRMRKLSLCIDRCLDSSTAQSICSAESASALTQCTEALQKIAVKDFPEELLEKVQLQEEGQYHIYAPVLTSAIKAAYQNEKLISEIGVSWASPSTTISINECVDPQSNDTFQETTIP